MKQILLSLALVFGGMATLSCGGSSSKKAAEEALAQTRQKLEQLESGISAENTQDLEVIEACREKIILANRRLIEGDADQALVILSQIEGKLSTLAGVVKGAKKATTFDVHGRVSFAGGDGTFERLTGKQKLSDVKQIKVSGRSGLNMKVFKSTKVFLPAQTDLTIKAHDAKAKRFQALLEVGEMILNKPKGKEVVEIEMNRFTFIANDECQAEFRFLPLVNSVYVAVFEGQLRYQGPGSSGTLFRYDGFYWKTNDTEVIQIPTVPKIDEPAHEAKVAIDPASGNADVGFRWHTNVFVANYQLQVSDSPLFVTRVYDNLRLERNQADVSLGKGTYFWRVRSINNQGIPGSFTKTMELHVGAFDANAEGIVKGKEKKKVSGPKISNLDYNLIGMTVIVSGRTKATVKVNVNGVAAVQNEDGTFQAIINFDRSGEHILRIMAMDPTTGGETVREKKIKLAN